MTFDVPKIDPQTDAAPGWWLFAKTCVLLRCPHGHQAVLRQPTDGHTIDDGGIVTPSVVCPYDGCAFHEMVRLLDWQIPTSAP